VKLAIASLTLIPALTLGALTTHASIYNTNIDARENAIKEATRKLCRASDEYIKTLKFLRKTKEFTFREELSRKIAEQVSKGCDGASERFAQVLLLLKTVGFSEKKSLQQALDFASESPDTQLNFVEIFSKLYLAEFFDYEYPKAIRLALDLSRDYQGDPAVARTDFIALVKFCKDTSNLDLPMSFCAEYAERVAKLSQYFITGVEKPFLTLFKDLREKKEFSLDVKAALIFSHDILRHGPKAAQNFFDAYLFAVKDHELTKAPAMELALKIASRSHIGATPPIMQFPIPKVSREADASEKMKLEQ